MKKMPLEGVMGTLDGGEMHREGVARQSIAEHITVFGFIIEGYNLIVWIEGDKAV